jgi:phenylalanyl-tRNA synthetase beta chain
LRASQRVTELICKIAGGKAADALNVAGELPPNPADVSMRYEQVDALLGTHVEPATAHAILTRFGLERKHASTSWKIPSYRRDLQREVDLIEEIARAYGIDSIPSANRSRFTPTTEADREYDFETELRRSLVALGLSEARTPALISRGELAKSQGAIALRNPLSEDHVSLRTSLIPGLLETIARNVRAGAERIALFEIGNVFAASGEQKRRFAVIMSGKVGSVKHWRGEKDRHYDFVDLKGALESLETDVARALTFRRTQKPGFIMAAEVFRENERLGICGQLSRAETEKMGAKASVLAAEIELAQFANWGRNTATCSEIERYPAIRRDVALFVPANVTHEEIASAIESAKEPLLERVELFDLFSEKETATQGEARKSLAYALTYRDRSRTLTSEEVNAAHARVRERLRKEVEAELREV